MTESAPAKINLCLFLGPLRPDGRHELVTVFESISLYDELALTVLDEGPDEVMCPGVEGPNLVSGALEALRAGGWEAPPVRIVVEKRIPVAAGLGGGSADAAAALRLAGTVAPLPEGLAGRVARELGADVPSQLRPGVWLGTGAGEELASVKPVAEHSVVIVPQDFPLSTADVYREADRLGLPRSPEELARLRQEVAGPPLSSELMVNDLEPATLSLCPAVGDALAALGEVGADRVLVCGSGPTCAGLWWGGADRAAEAARLLAVRYPGTALAGPA